MAAPWSKRVHLAEPAPQQLGARGVGASATAGASAAHATVSAARHALLGTPDLLKHIYQLMGDDCTMLAHMLVCKEFLRVLSSAVREVVVSPAAPIERLLARFDQAARLTLSGLHCTPSLRVAAAEGAPREHACVSQLCAALPRCAHLSTLDLSRARPCPAGVALLAAALPRAPALDELILDQAVLPADAAAVLHGGLSRCARLEALGMSMASAYASQHALLPLLGSFERLADLDLSLNGLGATGAELLRVSLPRCRSLASLNLASNSLTDGGVSALAHALSRCPVLACCNLAANGIGPGGALHLATFLPAWPALRALFLPLNNIGRRGLQHLAAALPACRLLEEVDLSGNGLQAEWLIPLADACHRASALHRVDVRRNDTTDPAECAALVRCFRDRRAQPAAMPECAHACWRLGGVGLTVDLSLSPQNAQLMRRVESAEEGGEGGVGGAGGAGAHTAQLPAGAADGALAEGNGPDDPEPSSDADGGGADADSPPDGVGALGSDSEHEGDPLGEWADWTP